VGPSTVYDVIASLRRGAQLDLLARTGDASWYQVRYGGREGWVHTSLIRANRDPSRIPVTTNIPPRPTAVPTRVPTATPTRPKATPRPAAPLSLSHSIEWAACISQKVYRVYFVLNVSGGTGQHTIYRDNDAQVVYGPGTQQTINYDLDWGAGSAAVGTLYARSGSMRAESKFWVKSLSCKDYK
jgi:hypothetical protein